MNENSSTWHEAIVRDVIIETPYVKTFVVELPHAVVHEAGQHYEIRLTSEDGYQAARLYSAASAANGSKLLQLTVAYLADGEVSPYLHEHIEVGDSFEVRGPLGRYFTWTPDITTPVLLLGGGSGVVPMRCMLMERAQAGATTPMKLLYSARSFENIIYQNELMNSKDVTITLSDSRPSNWRGESGRIDQVMLSRILSTLPASPLCYICGATPFVEAIANQLLALGVPAAQIKAERFGA